MAGTLAKTKAGYGVEIIIKPICFECLHMVKNKCIDLWNEYFDKRSKNKGIGWKGIGP